MNWSAIDLVLRYVQYRTGEVSDATATILITATPGQIFADSWDRLTDTIHEITQGLPVEFIRGKLDRGDAFDGRSNYLSNPHMGLSIGIKDLDWSTGTIGLYLQLEGSSKVYGPTCHHVVRPIKNSTKAGSGNYDPELNIIGKAHGPIEWKSHQHPEQYMEVPSLSDHQDCQNAHQEQIENWSKRIQDASEKGVAEHKIGALT